MTGPLGEAAQCWRTQSLAMRWVYCLDRSPSPQQHNEDGCGIAGFHRMAPARTTSGG
jgi:hypothetical protein